MSKATKQFGFKCGMTGKRRFLSQCHAAKRAGELDMRTYRCEFCAGWHLTKKRK